MTDHTESSTEVSTTGGSANNQETVPRARATKARAMDPKRALEKLNFTIDVNGDLGFLWDIKEQYPGMRASEIRRYIRMGIAAEAAGMQMSRHAGGIDAKQGDLQTHFGGMPVSHTSHIAREPLQIQATPSVLPALEAKFAQVEPTSGKDASPQDANMAAPKATADKLVDQKVTENKIPPVQPSEINNETKAAGAKAARAFLS